MNQRYLTKSRFKIGCECPTKLFYVGKPEYGNKKTEDAFLKALAQGGFQVGALARLFFEHGIEIKSRNTDEALAETQKYLERDSVTLFEPAIQLGNLLIRVDILVKKGDCLEIIEVKSKSYDPDEDDQFYTKSSVKKGKPEIVSKWQPYVLDIAFQTHVMRGAFPNANISSFLMLVDKSTKASIDGVNQLFFLSNEGHRTSVKVKPGLTRSDVGAPLLKRIAVDEQVELIFEEPIAGSTFSEYVNNLAANYSSDTMIRPPLGSQCKKCEYRIDEEMRARGLKNGFEQCWKLEAGFKPQDFSHPMVFDLWNFRGAKKAIAEKHYFIADLSKDDFDDGTENLESGLTAKQRQALQIEKVQSKDLSPWIDRDGLKSEMKRWKFPLHFIDFETTMVALPFHKGMRPYEQIAFQFSHHTLTSSGKVEHTDEYIHSKTGEFPNFEFVRRLKQSLPNDDGTVFRYSHHENTVLCHIYDQLAISGEPDRSELMQWIQTVTKTAEHARGEWQGERNMVDLCDVVKRFYYHPLTNGSNSIKAVLPSILSSSEFMQERYSQPIYGKAGGISSRNFSNHRWIEKDEAGRVKDPYKLLPKIWEDHDMEGIEALFDEDDEIKEGGAAMMAYARMQFTQMTEPERAVIRKALLKYCELDTLAMVMIYEYWKHEVGLF